MSSLSLSTNHEERVEQRSAANSVGQIVSDRTYNMVLGLTVLWGLGINAIMCATMGNFALHMNPIAFTIFYFICCFAGLFIAYKSNNPLISFVGYNMVVIPLGLELACLVAAVGGINTDVVMYAFVDTLLITGVMVIASLAFPNFFSKIGGILFAGLIGLLIVSLITMLLGGGGMWISVISAVLFSFYIGYDYWRSQQYAKTIDNAVDSAIDIYMDIALLFVQLVQIFANSNDRD